MPEVSTTTTSKPATLHAATTSGNAAEISLPKSRVAKLRMNTRAPLRHGLMAFMRMRSPSKAPPLLRREGSIDTTAMRRSSPWSKRKRRISSSVKDDLPAPPVPVMPNTGTWCLAASVRKAATMSADALPFSSTVISCDKERQLASVPPWMAFKSLGAKALRSLSQRITISPIMPMAQPSPLSLHVLALGAA